MTKEQFNTGISMLEAEYSNLRIMSDQTRYRLWAKAFADVDGRLFFMAIEKHITGSEFPPKVASLMKHIRAAETTAIRHMPPDKAFRKLCSLTRHYYHPEKLKLVMAGWQTQYPALYKTARNFDLYELAMMDIAEVPIVRAQFERYYREHCERADRETEYAGMIAVAQESKNRDDKIVAIEGLSEMLKRV